MWDLNYPQVWFTYGPQTKDDAVLRQLFEAGATGVRLTFSYGTPDLQVERAMQVRKIANEVGKKVCIVADLQGEKCRFSKIEGVDEIPVSRQEPILLINGDANLSDKPIRLPIQIPAYLNELSVGDIIVEGDGSLLLRVIGKQEDSVSCLPDSDGVIHPGRGLIVQKSGFRPKSMTSKDQSDLIAASASGEFDSIAISFVGESADIQQARDLMKKGGKDLPIIAKIETQLGIDNIGQIVATADAVMAARGDLALAMPWVDLYAAVSAISQAAAQNRTPWILATQLAEGLERFAFPTRAEICDLAHWISNGAYGAMVSYETAFGPRPIDAVKDVRAIVDRYKCIPSS